jgi:hypothetical protein
MSHHDLLPPALADHHQLPGLNTCAVSAFEAVAKLHGLIVPTAFPLQLDPKNQKKGFDDTSFLKALGIDCRDAHYDTQEAMELIEEETNAGRFPLVSLLGFRQDGKPAGYHILLCALHNSKLLLIDPAKPSIEADNKADLANLLEGNRQQNPHRKTLHILTYQLRKS